MRNTSHQRIATAVDVALLDEQGHPHPVSAALHYDRTDPYAVSLVLGGGESPIVWTFARELLTEGLRTPCGHGDVQVRPAPSDQGGASVRIALSSDSGAAVLEAVPAEIDAFVAATHALVAPGEESSYVDVDALLAAILGADSSR